MVAISEPLKSMNLYDIGSVVAKAVKMLPDVDYGPAVMRPDDPSYARRVEFDVRMTLANCGRWPAVKGPILDLGGGLGLFSITLALLGCRSIIADNFESWTPEVRPKIIEALEEAGVEVIQCDLLSDPPHIPTGTLQAVTSFHFLEHLHRSPRDLFVKAVDALVDWGTFVVAGPNCVNLRKRLTVPLGRGAWSPLDDWYGSPTFEGHVREPSIGDLVSITRDLGLVNATTYGRNFLGESHGGLLGEVASAAGPVLRQFPSLCSDIYAVARKNPPSPKARGRSEEEADGA